MTPLYRIVSSVGLSLVIIILVLIPFHALLTVWLGSNFGHYEMLRLWKEWLLLALVPIALYLVLARRALWLVFRWPVFWLIIAYALMHVVWGVVAWWQDTITLKAGLYAFIINLRFLAFMLICMALAGTSPWLKTHWPKLLLIPAVVVVSFGLLQALVLPADVLKHVGYGPETIPAFQAVDQKPDYARVQSTLRGPNPLGAYLVVVIVACAGFVVSRKLTQHWRAACALLAAAALVVLGCTYSRSAYAGAAVALLIVLWLLFQSPRARRWLLVGTIGLAMLVAGGIFAFKDHNLVQNVFFHTDESSAAARSSNEDRLGALRRGVTDVLSDPLGRGPGSAGPASQYNHQVRIAENYYLQIGQELGWLGLALFVAICLGLLATLWPLRYQTLPALLIASFIGISFVNLLSHAWADDTLGYIWWGLAGIALVPAILEKGGVKRHE